ncbi:MAG: PspC domain-containing protein [Propionibacteriaceae bacterium]|jgi:phage shock protein PspC (stress-responsive transcriptional regulator)|nr:PspC domain-containing protein [Propionibacteriaceae bacterium]
MTNRQLRRSTRDSVFGGVCGGLAEFFGVSALLVRLLFIGAAFFTAGSVLLLYIVLCVALPKDTTPSLAVAGAPQNNNRTGRVVVYILAAIAACFLLFGMIAPIRWYGEGDVFLISLVLAAIAATVFFTTRKARSQRPWFAVFWIVPALLSLFGFGDAFDIDEGFALVFLAAVAFLAIRDARSNGRSRREFEKARTAWQERLDTHQENVQAGNTFPLAPITVASFYSDSPAPTAPAPGTTIAARPVTERPRLVGLLTLGGTGLAVVVSLIAYLNMSWWPYAVGLPLAPVAVTAGVAGGLGLGLLASLKWGRPRWLAPAAVVAVLLLAIQTLLFTAVA